MSTILGREILRGHKLLRRQLGNRTFDWAGNAYLCTYQELRSGSVYELGGFGLTGDLILEVEYGLLPPTNPPMATKTITFRGKKFRIDHTGWLPGESVVALVCNDPNKKS